ncbi:hypothetical protein [Nibribacter koreensis]|uniref:hypothetical protein n=1 Tax=Nibribacter koreensis TaxID=1084519 RepID=UPI0031F19F9C
MADLPSQDVKMGEVLEIGQFGDLLPLASLPPVVHKDNGSGFLVLLLFLLLAFFVLCLVLTLLKKEDQARKKH